MRELRARLIAVLLAAVPLSAALATDPAPAPTDAGSALAAIRAKVEHLEFEVALKAIDALLADPATPPSSRVEGLALRAQIHDASGELAHAEADYREILTADPAFLPDPHVTSKKARDRFARLAAILIGTLKVTVDPPDAAVAIDGAPGAADPDGTFRVLAGDRSVSASAPGFDPATVVSHAVGGQRVEVTLKLVQNARAILVRTDVDGVAVRIDDRLVGTTERTDPSGAGPATLRIDAVAIGPHVVRLDKPCFATETVEALVSVDLDDRSAKQLPVATLRPARSRLTLVHADYPGVLEIDDAEAATLPAVSAETCPGRHRVAVRSSGRLVFSRAMDTGDADVTLDLAPRPSVVLVGGVWPQTWAADADALSEIGRVDAPAAGLQSASDWSRVDLPKGTDLAITRVARAGVAGEERVVAYSPLLGQAAPIDRPPPSKPPTFRAGTIGARVVAGPDARAMLVGVIRGGAAATAGCADGDALLTIDGDTVSSARDAAARIASAPAGSTLKLQVASPANGARAIAVPVTAVPWTPRHPPEGAILRAAWAAPVAAAGGVDAPSAYAGLAVLLQAAGKSAAAAEAWREAAAGNAERFQARADYAAGTLAAREGRSADAAAAFTRSRASARATGDPILEAAARDRLADLGVAPD